MTHVTLHDNVEISKSTYQTEYQRSVSEPDIFWGEQAEQFITWIRPWDKVLTGGFAKQDVCWFQGGILNASMNCLDRHLATRGEQVAIIWEGDDPAISQKLTYRELHADVCRLANVLRDAGVKQGDRVCIYLPMIPEAAIAMLACARLGAIHSVVFGGFSAESLSTRILDADCRLVITANAAIRGGKIIPLKQNVDMALQTCANVNTVIVVKRLEQQTDWVVGRDVWYHEVMARATTDCPAVPMRAEDPLFILYTSGSTGKPKGILHGTGGYLVYAAMTFRYIFDYQAGEVYWCTADVGWVTGHTYGVYGPLLNGATIVMFEGVPHYPTPSRYWEVVDKYRVAIFYTAPTAIRALRREGDAWVACTQRTSLRVLGSVGEPINPEAWIWYDQVVGEKRCQIVDTWWQTETGGVMISPLPYVTPLKAGSAAWPFFGVVPEIIDDAGNSVTNHTMGRLVITQPWPGMMQTIYGDHERFINTYFKEVPGCYLTGDQAHCDEDGYYWIAGRSDDVLKVSGHRIGTEEVESALMLNSAVSEAAVVGIPDDIKGQKIYAFVTLKLGYQPTDTLKQTLVSDVRQHIGAIAAPDYIHWAEGLPKTRSGKIMRRVLRKIATGDTTDMGDLSTLADPSVVATLIEHN